VHAELYLPTHAPVVGNVGALVEQKGQHHLIEAAASSCARCPTCGS
jgi:glycosyltransferase involved in cell wall biosynthesis